MVRLLRSTPSKREHRYLRKQGHQLFSYPCFVQGVQRTVAVKHTSARIFTTVASLTPSAHVVGAQVFPHTTDAKVNLQGFSACRRVRRGPGMVNAVVSFG
ncbi:hypothetical protein BHM03_00006337 [Ensete ventricosum]|nr:hypothetical protein BHM03_00006337 [Ensete ventricosum]